MGGQAGCFLEVEMIKESSEPAIRDQIIHDHVAQVGIRGKYTHRMLRAEYPINLPKLRGFAGGFGGEIH